MLNITINGEAVTIKEQTKLSELIAVDCYAVNGDGKVCLMIPKELDTPKLDEMSLYVAGVITADDLGYMETVTDAIEVGKITYNSEWEAYTGIKIAGDFETYDAKAGIKVYFGRC